MPPWTICVDTSHISASNDDATNTTHNSIVCMSQQGKVNRLLGLYSIGNCHGQRTIWICEADLTIELLRYLRHVWLIGRLFWIFQGAPLKVNEALVNMQGNLKALQQCIRNCYQPKKIRINSLGHIHAQEWPGVYPMYWTLCGFVIPYVSIGLCVCLMIGGTKPLPEPLLTYD